MQFRSILIFILYKPSFPHRTASVCYLEMAKRKHNCPRRSVTENVKKKKMKEKTTKVRIESDAKMDKKPTTWQLCKKLCTRLHNPAIVISILGQLALWVLGAVFYQQPQQSPTPLPCPCISTPSPSPSPSPSTWRIGHHHLLVQQNGPFQDAFEDETSL